MTSHVSDTPATIEYRAPFLWAALDVVRHLRTELGGPALVSARSTYFALAELHAEGLPATKEAIAERAGISVRKVRPHLARLESLGLLEIARASTATGADGRSVYRLMSSPADPLGSGVSDSSRGDEASAVTPEPAFLQGGRSVPPGEPVTAASPHSSWGDEASHQELPGETDRPPSRAHHNVVKAFVVGSSASAEQPTTSQTGECASGNMGGSPSSIEQARALWPDLTQPERDVLKQLVEVAKARGLDRGWDPAAAIAYMRNEFSNRAHAEEAAKFRDYYSPGGSGENRRFTNLVLRWRNWLNNAPTADTLVALDQRRSAPGRRGGAPLDAAAISAEADERVVRSEEARRRRRQREDAMAERFAS